MARAPRDPEAPHGRDDNGEPLAPYGYKTDGKPRLDGRGARPGQSGQGGSNTRAKATVTSLTDRQRKGMLCDLADSFLVTPLAAASEAKPIVARIGTKQATAIAGDAYILAQFVPSLADSVIVFSKSRPGVLAWMDKVEQNAPWLMMAQVGIQLTKALVQNHLNPQPAFAAAGRNYVKTRLAAMADEINRVAAMADEINRQANTARTQHEETEQATEQIYAAA